MPITRTSAAVLVAGALRADRAASAAVWRWDRDEAAQRALEVGKWLHHVTSASQPPPPPRHWRFTHEAQLSGERREISGGPTKLKTVELASFEGMPVAIKSALAEPRLCLLGWGWRRRPAPCPGGLEAHDLHMWTEVVTLEYLRGLDGIPALFGGFIARGRFHAVVEHAGVTLALQPKHKVTVPLLDARYRRLAGGQPRAVACAILRLFRSFAELGEGFLEDFTPSQFAVREGGGHVDVFLVDGLTFPSGPMHAPVAAATRAVFNVTGERMPLTLSPPPPPCRSDADCPSTMSWHCCCDARKGKRRGGAARRADRGNRTRPVRAHRVNKCGLDSLGAPEAAGTCGATSTCTRVGHLTHAFDVASRPWLLPLLAGDDLPGAGRERNRNSTPTMTARDGGHARAEIRSLMAAMLQPAPAARPSFTSALERLRCGAAGRSVL